jgi:hypothetical protein
MSIRGLRPEVEDHLRKLAGDRPVTNQRPIDEVIATFMMGPGEEETRALARQIYAAHREFFDLIGDR